MTRCDGDAVPEQEHFRVLTAIEMGMQPRNRPCGADLSHRKAAPRWTVQAALRAVAILVHHDRRKYDDGTG